jgi:ketosteroid isomerase-like protein
MGPLSGQRKVVALSVRTVPLALAGAVLASLASCGPATDSTADQVAVRKAGAQAIEALNQGDIGALSALMREDVVVMYQDGPTLVGRRQVREQLGRIAKSVSLQLARQNERITMSGDWAFYHSVLTGTMTPSTGPPIEIKTEAFDILKREPDDSWKYVRMMGIPYWSLLSREESR